MCQNKNCKCIDCKCKGCECAQNTNPVMERPQATKNNLHTKEECPNCHSSFISGFDPHNQRLCPSCKTKFIAGQKIDHGKGCSICSGRYQRNSLNTGDQGFPSIGFKGQNNVYYRDGCPALMSDGRFITYYNSTNELTEAMRKLNGFTSPNQFRTFMQNNGDLFMNSERDYITKENTCSPKIACSEGWYDLWTKYGGDWAGTNSNPQPIRQ